MKFGSFGIAAFGAVMVLLSGPAGAATLWEDDALDHEFSGDWAAPTKVGNGYDVIEGTGSQNAYDTFVFTDMATGAQDVVLTFSTASKDVGDSYSAGGMVKWDVEKFDYGWDGIEVSPAIQLQKGKTQQEITLSLPDSFAGELWLALYFTHGADIAYSLFAPGNAASVDLGTGGGAGSGAFPGVAGGSSPAGAPAVPLPPALALLGGALAAAGIWGRRRRAA